MKEYVILPEEWYEVSAIYYHVYNKLDEDKMWDFIQWLEYELMCKINVYCEGEQII